MNSEVTGLGNQALALVWHIGTDRAKELTRW